MKERFYGSLILGAVTAVIVSVWSGTSNHAKLAAEAAKNHTTVASTLMAGLIIIGVVVAVIVFVLTSIASAMRPQRRPYRGSVPPVRRRERAGTRR